MDENGLPIKVEDIDAPVDKGFEAKSPKAAQIYYDKDGKPYTLSKTGKPIPQTYN